MSRQLIDLSIPLENEIVSDPVPFTPRISYFDHQMSVAQLCAFFPGLKPEDLPDGEAWAIEKVELITHNGTHLDAPYHFASTMNEGERALTIDEVPPGSLAALRLHPRLFPGQDPRRLRWLDPGRCDSGLGGHT